MVDTFKSAAGSIVGSPPFPPLALGRDAAMREFVFSSADFERIRQLIHKYAGISLTSVKQDMVYSRLARRLRATGKKTFSDYLDVLERGNSEEWECFVNSLTTNLTSFFREPHHFPIFAELLRKIGSRRPIRVWCCASSTGEEPYSIAMTVHEALGSDVSQVQILASDLDTSVLATARRGNYPADRVDKIESERLRRFFHGGAGVQAGTLSVKPELQRLVEFQRINLLDPMWPVRGPLDAIFCRNVMIYFDKPTQYKILSRFAPLLRDEGLLFVGHSESLLHAEDIFRSLGKTVYAVARKSHRAG